MLRLRAAVRLIVFAGVAATMFLLPVAGAESTVTRELPESVVAGRGFVVSLRVDWGTPPASVVAIEERLPDGWIVAPGKEPSNGGSTQASGFVKWFLLDKTAKELTYVAQPPVSAVGSATFGGIFRDDTMPSSDGSPPIVGDAVVEVSPQAAGVVPLPGGLVVAGFAAAAASIRRKSRKKIRGFRRRRMKERGGDGVEPGAP
jgi:hypothetical protein